MRLRLLFCMGLMASLSLSCTRTQDADTAALPADSLVAPQDPLAQWNAALQQNPRDANALFNRAVALEDRGDDRAALQDYEALSQVQALDKAQLIRRAGVRMRLGMYEAALADYAAAGQSEADQALYLNARGVMLMAQNSYAQAIAALDSAIALNPRMAEAWYNKGTALYESGKVDEAEYHFQKTIHVSPRHSEAYSALGMLFQYQHRDSLGADWYYKQALSFDQQNASAWFGLGNLDYAAGRIESAILNYDKALAADSTAADA